MNLVLIGSAVAVLVMLIGLILFVIGIYNRLVAARQEVEKAFANIDVLLRQRYSELGNLVETVKGYMAHEKGTFEKITEARSAYNQAPNLAGKVQAENALAGLTLGLFARMEAYPDLKANANAMQLQQRITALEALITERRDYYNEAVTGYNIFIAQFPILLIAGPMNFTKQRLLATPAESKKDVEIKF